MKKEGISRLPAFSKQVGKEDASTQPAFSKQVGKKARLNFSSVFVFLIFDILNEELL